MNAGVRLDFDVEHVATKLDEAHARATTLAEGGAS